jgi:hypothetical protein
MKRIVPILLCLCLCACNSAAPSQNSEKFTLTDEATKNETLNTCSVVFSKDGADIKGSGAAFNEKSLAITDGGEYTLSGKLKGCITVDITKNKKATLILSDLKVESETAAINIISSDKVDIVLKGKNSLSDGKTYADEKGAEPSACLYSADDIEISGDGSLAVKANSKNGIESKNDVKISGGSIEITAAKNAIKGKDSVKISAGSINIPACYDGIKSDNEKEDGRGIVEITGGKISMTCSDDGIQAYRSVNVQSAEIKINARGKKINCDGQINAAENCIN